MIVLLVTYFFLLLFNLVTHRELCLRAILPVTSLRQSHGLSGNRSPHSRGATVLVAVLSEFLVGSIESARHALGLTETFVGVIVIAFVGNAAEHSTAVWAAWKNKMDLSLGIAAGSSLQIALFVTPVLVLASYGFGAPMTLEFSLPEIASIALAIWIFSQIAATAKATGSKACSSWPFTLLSACSFSFCRRPRALTTPAMGLALLPRKSER